MTKVPAAVTKESQSRLAIPKNVVSILLLGLVLLLGAGLRFYDLGTESYWLDEMYTLLEGQQTIPQMLASGRLDQPPAFYLLFHYWLQAFGTAEANTRVFSVLFGIASIAIIYLIGRELFNETIGLLGGLLMAISGFQIYYSQIARFYIFFEFATLLSFLFYIIALRRKRLVSFALYTAASILMVYSNAFGVFILVAQNIYFFLQWQKTKTTASIWLICQALILFSVSPFFIYGLTAADSSFQEVVVSNVAGLPPPSFTEPFHSLYRFVLPARRQFGGEIVYTSFAIAGTLLIVLSGIYAIKWGKHNWIAAVHDLPSSFNAMPNTKNSLVLLLFWLSCPIVLLFLTSIVLIPMYKDYYTIGAAPALYLLLAWGMFSIRKVIPVIISLLALAIMIGPSLREYYVTDVNEQWAEAASYVTENSRPGDAILFAPNESKEIQQRSFNWYYRGDLAQCGLNVDPGLPNSSIWEAVRQCIEGHNRFWVVIRGMSHDRPAVRYKSFFLDPINKAIRLIGEKDLVGISIYLFEANRTDLR